jgi:hypothetical protein
MKPTFSPTTVLVGALISIGTPVGGQSTSPSEPGARVAGVFVVDSLRNRLVVYGGTLVGPPGTNVLDPDPRTFAWNGSAWTVIAANGPRSRDEQASAIDPRDGSVLVVNGRGIGEQLPPDSLGRRIRERILFRETWRFDGARWTLLDTLGPEGGASLQAAFDVARGRLVAFGGTVGNSRDSLRSATWEWDGRRWARLDVPGPPGRTGHSMAYDHKARRVIVHGGIRAADRVPLTDTWAWDGTRWRLLTMEGPRSAFGAAASDPDSGIVVFGGHAFDKPISDSTWYWNGRAWVALPATGPAPRTFNHLATDFRNRRIYLFGGYPSQSGAVVNDLWYLDSRRSWIRVTPLNRE